MGEVWRKAHHLLGEQLRNADIAVVVDLPDDLPPIYGVAEQLGQVLINLALNALDSMPNGGLLRIACQARAGWLEVTCADNGPAIAAEHLGRVFDPFFTTKPGGVGLGLFVSHGIVQQHGGNLTVANLPEDQGVCFTITLPIAAAQRPEREVAVAEDIQP
jgi:signal transduction histidine kinase